MRTGYLPSGPVQYPPLGALVSKELGASDSALPNFVSIGPIRGFNPASFTAGFLGPQYAPLIVGENAGFNAPGNIDPSLRVQDLDVPGRVNKPHADARLRMLLEMEHDFAATRPGIAPASH